MALEGNLQVAGLPEILRTISGDGKTGILTVQGEQDIIAISFLAGEVVAADALNQTVEEGLGQVLSEQGLVARERLAALAFEQQAAGGRLVEILLQKGVVDRPQLLGALRLQTYQLLLRVLRWREGEFKFYGGDEVSYEDGFAPISVEELLIRSAVDLGGDLLAGPVPEDSDVFEPAAGVGGNGDATLGADEQQLLALFDGRRSIGDLGRESGLGEYKARFLVHRLQAAGLVRPAPPPPAAPPAAEPRTTPAAASVASAARAESLPASTEPVREADDLPVDRPRVVITRWVPAAAVGLAVILLAVLVPEWILPGSSPLLPFPWQEEQRASFVAERRRALQLRIDRACRTFYLLEGRYPESLGDMVDLGLLTPADRLDPSGVPLEFAPSDVSYTLRPSLPGAVAISEGITGDFLLDPELVHPAGGQPRAPLVLLD